jgi:hypothetical protein
MFVEKITFPCDITIGVDITTGVVFTTFCVKLPEGGMTETEVNMFPPSTDTICWYPVGTTLVLLTLLELRAMFNACG